jgi:hypothetical protein
MRDPFSTAEGLHDAAGLVAFRDDATAVAPSVVEHLILNSGVDICVWV